MSNSIQKDEKPDGYHDDLCYACLQCWEKYFLRKGEVVLHGQAIYNPPIISMSDAVFVTYSLN